MPNREDEAEESDDGMQQGKRRGAVEDHSRGWREEWYNRGRQDTDNWRRQDYRRPQDNDSGWSRGDRGNKIFSFRIFNPFVGS